MQSFLGTVVICYLVRAIPLYNMTTASYDWSTAWSDKELLALEDIKQAVIQSCSLHYPDDSKVLVIETMHLIMVGDRSCIRLGPTK